MRVMFLNRRLYLPAFLWFILTAATFLLAFLQETDLVRIVPFLKPDTAYTACLLLFAAYVLFVWPFSVAALVRSYALLPRGRIRFAATALSAPLALFLIEFPLLQAAAYFAGQDPRHPLAMGLGFLAPIGAILLFFHLGFFFSWRPLRHYMVGVVFLTAGLPLLDLVLTMAYGRGAGAFGAANPFHFVLSTLEGNPLHNLSFGVFIALHGGAALLFASLPLAWGRLSSEAYRHLAFHQDDLP
jgi:hypothetical protein